ncbi:MAG: guanylate kinase [Leptospiraceae bacterium]|nr:guanylate kinase [Leptospiraceae bacterium]MDW8305860.1 guanylate kinase [Leptospiraceae bacterium]
MGKTQPRWDGVIVLSGPSGTGKNTLISELLRTRGDLLHSISCTTRPPRNHEQNGIQYYFLSKEEFLRKIEENAFVEYAEVMDHYYGTSFAELERIHRLGKIPILDVDVKGALQLRRRLSKILLIFIKPPSFEILEERLRQRKTESQEEMEKRLERAKKELAYAPYYDKVIVNDDLHRAVRELSDYLDNYIYGGKT